jgi:exodeoxyribonuclease-3
MKLLSLNIRHGGGSRFEKIKNYLSSHEFDVLLLQEFRDNATGQLIKQYLEKIGFQYVYNITDKTQNTVLTAAKTLTEVSMTSKVNDWSYLITEINSVKIVNVYFPQKNDKKVVFEYIKKMVKDTENIIVAGDFNTGDNKLDAQGAKFHCSREFIELSVEILNDAFRLLHKTEREYSWYSNQNNGFRIDHVLVSDDLKDNVHSIKYDQTTRLNTTDHAALHAEIIPQKEINILIEAFKNEDKTFEDKFNDYVSQIIPFDWMSWEKGQKFFEDNSTYNIVDFNKVELQKLLLMASRVDKFNDGFFMKQKKNGSLLHILNELKQK